MEEKLVVGAGAPAAPVVKAGSAALTEAKVKPANWAKGAVAKANIPAQETEPAAVAVATMAAAAGDRQSQTVAAVAAGPAL
jgi:hypothetical protein